MCSGREEESLYQGYQNSKLLGSALTTPLCPQMTGKEAVAKLDHGSINLGITDMMRAISGEDMNAAFAGQGSGGNSTNHSAIENGGEFCFSLHGRGGWSAGEVKGEGLEDGGHSSADTRDWESL